MKRIDLIQDTIFEKDWPKFLSLLSPESVHETDRDGRTPLILAVIGRAGRRTIGGAVEAGSRVNMADKYGWTALHFASQNQDPEAAEELLSLGADPNARDEFGNSPLFRAVFSKTYNAAVVRALLKAGANPDQKNAKDKSARDIALVSGDTPLAALLEQKPNL